MVALEKTRVGLISRYSRELDTLSLALAGRELGDLRRGDEDSGLRKALAQWAGHSASGHLKHISNKHMHGPQGPPSPKDPHAGARVELIQPARRQHGLRHKRRQRRHSWGPPCCEGLSW